MSSSYKPQVGDIVIPSCGRFEGLRCKVAVVGGHIGVECLQKTAEGHNLDGYLSKPNGWWYYSSDLKHQSKDNSSFKVGDRVASPDYPERGPGTVRHPISGSLILVEHDDIFKDGHDGDGACSHGTGWYYTESQLQIVHEVKPEAKPEPKPNFKVGDVVESTQYTHRGPGVIIGINESVFAVEHFKHIGTHSCRGLGKDGHCWNYVDGQFVLSSASKPEEPKAEKPNNPQEVTSLDGYSLGDRVTGCYGPGTVVHFSESGSIGVEHDKYIGYHNCNGYGRYGYCWYFNAREIGKLEPTPLDTVGSGISGSIGITGEITGGVTATIVGSNNSAISNDSSPLMWGSYATIDSRPYAGSGIWAEIEYLTESKKPKNSVDKYIQDPIIPKKTRKKKSLVIV